MNSNLEYLADSLLIEALAKDDPMVVVAQDGSIMASVAEGVKDYVASQFDRKRPIASIAAFLGRGLLWSMGFKWTSVLYTVAEALGFDWKSFWSAVGRNMMAFAKTILGSKRKASESEASVQINNVVQEAFNNNFSGEVDKEKLFDVARGQSFSNDVQDALDIKAAALRLQNNPKLIKEAGVLSLFKGKLSRFFIRIIGWLIKTAFVSLGFVVGAGAVSGLVGYKRDTEGDEQGSETDAQEGGSPIYKLPVSSNVPGEIFTVHPNNMSNVWIERGDINNIQNILKSWVSVVYPQLNMDKVENSSSFQSMVNKFRARNRLAMGLGMISVPRPYQRKSDIVSAIVSGFLRESPQESNSSDKPETVYK